MRAFEQAQLTIRSLLARGLAATTVARLGRLTGASEVWGGATPLDRPAWYLWLAQAAGAYRLELEDATPLEHGRSSSSPPERGWHARLSIRYYPSPGERSFPTFSAEEREVVLGGSLDRTGTPRIEVAAAIPPHLFVVGSLEWAESSERLGAVLALTALDRVRVAAARDARVAADEPVPAPLRAPPLDRDVPGWTLATPLLTSIAAIHAQLHGQVLERAVLARQRGFELVRGPDGTYLTHDTDEVARGDALLGFVVPRAPGASDRIVDALVDPAAVVVADERFGAGCRHPAALEAQPRIPLAVSDAWFGGAAHVETGLTCAC